MASRASKNPFAAIAACAFCCLIATAVARIHLRVETTMIGYDIGQLKKAEGQLLEDRAYLKMRLAQLTTRKHLLLVSKGTNSPGKAGRKTLASTESSFDQTTTR